ncbi:unnamed protein product [Discosporangium mesarthrocarpum]
MTLVFSQYLAFLNSKNRAQEGPKPDHSNTCSTNLRRRVNTPHINMNLLSPISIRCHRSARLASCRRVPVLIGKVTAVVMTLTAVHLARPSQASAGSTGVKARGCVKEIPHNTLKKAELAGLVPPLHSALMPLSLQCTIGKVTGRRERAILTRGGAGQPLGQGALVPPQRNRMEGAGTPPTKSLGPISRQRQGQVQGAGEREKEEEVQKFGAQFLDFESRVGFMRKVYLTLSVQLLYTGCICAGVRPHRAQLRRWLTGGRWNMNLFLLGTMAGWIVPTIYLQANKEVRQNFPRNLPMLTMFTTAYALYVAAFTLFFTDSSILVAAAQTAFVSGALTAYAFRTNPKHELTAFGSSLYAFACALSFFALMKILFFRDSPVMQLGVSCLFALVFSLYIIFDTYRIIGGKHRSSGDLGTKDWALGAICLYTDIIHLFLHLLSIFGNTE